MENKKQKENRQALKWVYLFASLFMFAIVKGTLSSDYFREYTGLTMITLLLGLLFFILWFTCLDAPKSTTDKVEVNSSNGGQDISQPQKSSKHQYHNDYIDKEEKMRDEDIEAYLKSRNEGL